LVVAEYPPFFNNNQRTWQHIAFWLLTGMQVTGWLWRIQQAEQTKTNPSLDLLLVNTAFPSTMISRYTPIEGHYWRKR
jgi:hypothetical protein